MPFVSIPIVEKLAANTDRSGECWVWTAAKNRQGYGRVWHGGNRYAHRVSYELVNGPVPDGLYLDHLCRNPSCIRPDHLEAVTQSVNVRRGAWSALKPAKTDCRFGHGQQFTDAHGHGRCRVCHNKRQREYYARKFGVSNKGRRK